MSISLTEVLAEYVDAWVRGYGRKAVIEALQDLIDQLEDERKREMGRMDKR